MVRCTVICVTSEFARLRDCVYRTHNAASLRERENGVNGLHGTGVGNRAQFGSLTLASPFRYHLRNVRGEGGWGGRRFFRLPRSRLGPPKYNRVKLPTFIR